MSTRERACDVGVVLADTETGRSCSKKQTKKKPAAGTYRQRRRCGNYEVTVLSAVAHLLFVYFPRSPRLLLPASIIFEDAFILDAVWIEFIRLVPKKKKKTY